MTTIEQPTLLTPEAFHASVGFHVEEYPYQYPEDLPVCKALFNHLVTSKPSLRDALVLMPGLTEPTEDIDRFDLTQIHASTALDIFNSMRGSSQYVALPPGITPEYGETGKMPYCDGVIGVGITYKKRLVAMVTGGLSRYGAILNQIQDVSLHKETHVQEPGFGEFTHRIRKRASYNGLNSGIDWRRTLVSAWLKTINEARHLLPEPIAEKPIWIQSACNNRNYTYVKDLRARYDLYTRLFGIYDVLAVEQGAKLDKTSGNYYIPRS